MKDSHRQLSESIQQLSPERLQVLADFAAYLVNAESEAATQELLTIPGLLERVQQNQATPKSDYANWRTIRADAEWLESVREKIDDAIAVSNSTTPIDGETFVNQILERFQPAHQTQA